MIERNCVPGIEIKKVKLNGSDYEKGIKISERGFSNGFVESSTRYIDYPAFD